MNRPLRHFNRLAYGIKSIFYNEEIISKNSKKFNRFVKKIDDPLFFLKDRRIKHVPNLSVSHHLEFYRLKMLATPNKGMTSKEMLLDPPKCVRGMTQLDRSKFQKVITVPCLRCPVETIQSFAVLMKRFGLKMVQFSPIVDLNQQNPDYKKFKLLLLNPLKLSKDETVFLDVKKLEDRGVIKEEHELHLTYENWDFADIIRAVLPEELKVSSFSTVGHIAHFNLRDETLPYKHIIGEVVLDKLSHIKTVVNKLDTIDNTYRNFQMEVLAGEPNFVTQTREAGCTFELDFSKVYWNSRLSTEHQRIVDLVKDGDLFLDVFAGIGPFAVPASRKKAEVYANDLNPSSYESLVKNFKLNKTRGVSYDSHSYNLDGREFIETVVKEQLVRFYTEDSKYSEPRNVHIVMNLPAMAVTFLDAFKNLLADTAVDRKSVADNLPNVHCYSFTDIEEALAKWDGDKSAELKQRVVDIAGLGSVDDVTLRYVRDVAPNKEMMCARFKLTTDVLLGKSINEKGDKSEEELEGEPPRKVMKAAE